MPVLVLDSGNLLFKKSPIPQGESSEKITAVGIIDAYGKMGYDAVAVGPLDLIAGPDFLKKQSGPHLSWISANLFNADNSPVFKSFIIKKTGQSQIGIVGLTNRAAFLQENLHIVDWHTVLPGLLQTLSNICDHVIVLSNLPDKENNEIAQNYPDINIIISADPQFGNLSPVLKNKTLITQTANQGKSLGMLNIEWGSKSVKWVSDENQLRLLNSKADTINRQIQKLESQQNPSRDTLRLERYINNRQEITQQIESLSEKILEDNRKGVTLSTFTSNFITLISSMPDSVDIEQIIAKMKQQISTLNRSSQ
jgi:2',3'-cyclic-nucleotide 2'-phosphodiesterase (5'-nucleotidase family)